MKTQTFASLSILALASCTDDGSSSPSASTAGMTDPTASATSGAGDDEGGGEGTGDESGPGSDSDSSADTGASSAGSASETGSADSSAEGGGTGGDLDPLEVCEAYEVVYDECIFPSAARYEFCDEYILEYLNPDDVCGQAMLENFACLSQLDCKTLNDPAEIPCRDVYEGSHAACPEVFGPCTEESNGWGPNDESCFYEFSRCLDGSTYRIDCESSGASSTCTCTIDGGAAGTFDVPTGEPDCYGMDFRTGAEDLCGFPNFLIPLN